MPLRSFLLLACSSLITTVCALAAGNAVTGVVSSSIAKQPLFDATISVNGKNQAITDLRGEFTLININPGDIIRAQKKDYVGVSAVASSRDEMFRLELAPIWQLDSVSQIYSDVTDTDWYGPAVRQLYERQTLSVKNKTNFDPATNITRGELADLLVKAAGFLPETPRNIGFCDIKPEARFAASIEFMRRQGWVGGYTSTVANCTVAKDFRADLPTNRASAIKMISTVFQDLIREKISKQSCPTPNLKDVQASDWYAPFVTQASCLGFIKGYSDNTFRPGNYINRAEIAIMLNNVLQNLN